MCEKEIDGPKFKDRRSPRHSLCARRAQGTHATYSLVTVVGVVLVSFSSSAVFAQARFHPSHVLVRFQPGAVAAAKTAAHAEAQSMRMLRAYTLVNGLQLVEVPEGKVEAAVAAYRNNPNVLYAEPDYVLHLTGNVPNDSSFCAQWGMHNLVGNIDDGCIGCPLEQGVECPNDFGASDSDIDAVQAWDEWTGDPDFRIAVIDTGIDLNHPDLAANIWTNPGETGMAPSGNAKETNGTDDDANGYVDDVHGYKFLSPSLDYPTPDPMDDDGHGTHVAGTIAAVGNNGIGVAGVNWRAKIVALKIFNADVVALASDAVKALGYCLANNILLSNNSYVFCECTDPPCEDNPQVIYDAIDSLRQPADGHLVITGAGNFENDGSCLDFVDNDDSFRADILPATFDLDNIISVAATDNNDQVPDWSHYGATTVDVGAPRVNIYSTDVTLQPRAMAPVTRM